MSLSSSSAKGLSLETVVSPNAFGQAFGLTGRLGYTLGNSEGHIILK